MDVNEDFFVNAAPVTEIGKTRAVSMAAIPQRGFDFDHMQFSTMQAHAAAKAVLAPAHTAKPTMKDDISIQVIPSSSAIHTNCRERPKFVGSTHFMAQEKNSVILKEKIDAVLSKLHEDIHFEHCDKEFMWRIRFFSGSDMRDLVIWCYWCSAASDHLVEFKRISGEGCSPPTREFFEKIKNSVLGLSTEPEPVNKRMRTLELPLPQLKRSHSTGSSMPVPPSFSSSMFPPLAPVATSHDQFIEGLQRIVSMSNDDFMESRLESARVLCDTAKRSRELLQHPAAVQLIASALNKLIHHEEYEEVKQFAIMACSMFAENTVYLHALANMTNLSCLGNVCADYNTFDWLGARRRALRTLALLSDNFKQEVLAALPVDNEDDWNEMMTNFRNDKQSYDSAKEILEVFA